MNNVKIKGFILALLVSVSPLSAGWFSDLSQTAKNCLSTIWSRKDDLLQTGVFGYIGSSLASHPCLLTGLCIAVAAPCVYKVYKNNQKQPNLQELAQKAATVTVARRKQKRGWLPCISWPKKWSLTSSSVQNDKNIPSPDQVPAVISQVGKLDIRNRNNKKPVQQRGIRYKRASRR